MTANRRDFIKTMGKGAAGLAVFPLIQSCRAPREPLNIVFVLADDLGWTDGGAFGSSFYETPRIDRLCAEGMRFRQAYAACPVCSPTRASIMTGKYPARLSTTDYFGAPQPTTTSPYWRSKPLLPAPYKEYLPLEELTLAESFKASGYATFFAGKWHLGGEGFYPEDQGFEVNRGGWERGGPYGGGKYFSPYGNPRLSDGPDGEHLPDRLAEETCRFIEQHQNKSFLAYLSFYSVHTPLMARPDLEEKYRNKAEGLSTTGPKWGREGERQVRLVQNHAVYAGMIEAMDQAVGKVLDCLKRLNLERRTVIVFMSDNGGLSTSEGHPTSNLPLRAGKGWLYEGGIREPMVVRWPGVVQPGGECDEPVMSTDFYPTLLEMAGLPPNPGQHLDGVSLVPLLKKVKSLPQRPLFWHYPHYGNQGGSPGGAVRLGDWKLIEFFEDMCVELYNLRDDLSEKNDLSSRFPGKVDEMRRLLHEWRESVGALMPSPRSDTGGRPKSRTME
ncbi:MAG: sulfatase [Candidatus Aminicenantes bacterium]|nr:sulfatase [Candidatus Aminicenantes bacterium]